MSVCEPCVCIWPGKIGPTPGGVFSHLSTLLFEIGSSLYLELLTDWRDQMSPNRLFQSASPELGAVP